VVVDSLLLNNASQTWIICEADRIERVHMQICEVSNQNDFIYGELGNDYKSIHIYI